MEQAERAFATPPKITFDLLPLMARSQLSCHDSDLLQLHGPLNPPFQVGRRKRFGGALPILRIRALIKAHIYYFLPF